MTEIKHCERCGVEISDINQSDYYSHIAKKYCSECAAEVKKEKTLERVHKLRSRKRVEKRMLLDEIKKLQTENAVLRRMLQNNPQLMLRKSTADYSEQDQVPI